MSALSSGTSVLMQDQQEGWFPLAPAAGLRGSVLYAVQTEPPDHPLYVIELDQPLEIQEKTGDTPSGFRSIFYSHVVIKSRWRGVEVGSESEVSAYLLLPEPGAPLPTTKAACLTLPIRAWASCRIPL
jgi:hypothetical protein